MKIKTYKDVTAVSGGCYFGFRFMCNISPEEMEKRKKEIIKHIFEEWDFECSVQSVDPPQRSIDLYGYWYYMVDFKG